MPDGRDVPDGRAAAGTARHRRANNHDWQATTPVLRAIRELMGRSTVEVTTTPPQGEAMYDFFVDLDQYDVVVSNYNGDAWSEAMQAELEQYVRSGGGLVVYHAADHAFPDWLAYNETPGPRGSHGQRHAYLVETRQPGHPIMQGLPDALMHVEDELYYRLRGPAEDLTVLATAYSDPGTGKTGEHEPVLMTIEYGEGRIFHTVLGHDVDQLQYAGFQTTLVRGTEWAATGRVKSGIKDDFPGRDSVSVRRVGHD